jgi:hypothetical protein
MRLARSSTLAALALVVAIGVGACGNDTSPSGVTAQTTSPQTTSPQTTAQGSPGVAAVCTAAHQLSTAVHTVVADLQAGDVRAARHALPAAASAATDLADATRQLQSAERAKVDPQVEDVSALLPSLSQSHDALRSRPPGEPRSVVRRGPHPSCVNPARPFPGSTASHWRPIARAARVNAVTRRPLSRRKSGTTTPMAAMTSPRARTGTAMEQAPRVISSRVVA